MRETQQGVPLGWVAENAGIIGGCSEGGGSLPLNPHFEFELARTARTETDLETESLSRKARLESGTKTKRRNKPAETHTNDEVLDTSLTERETILPDLAKAELRAVLSALI